jgi:hypothetical protein
MVDFVCKNYDLIIVALVVLAFIGYEVYTFIKLPNGKKKERIIQWLIYACSQAEISYGAKTGSLKLKSVWSEFIKAFPVIAKLISYEKFSKLVDEALVEMKKMIENNDVIKSIISQ